MAEKNSPSGTAAEGAAAVGALDPHPPYIRTQGELALQVQNEVAAFIAACGGKDIAWTQERHCIFLARLVGAELGLDVAKRKALAALLGIQGVGGNASQFQQWLRKEAPKGAGLLAPKAAASLAAYEGIE